MHSNRTFAGVVGECEYAGPSCTTHDERGCRCSGYRSLAASRAAIFYRNDVSESKIFAALRAAFQLSVAILESIPYLPMGVTASGGLKHTLPTPRRLNRFYPTERNTQILWYDR